MLFTTRKPDLKLLHKCIIVVSDEMSHSTASVLKIIDQLIPEVKLLNQDTTCIHYWMDSPTSQYRNKVIFNTIANHEIFFGVKAKLNFWDAGHGMVHVMG